MWLGGKWTQGAESIAVRAPFDGRLLAEVSSADRDQCEQSIEHGAQAAKQMRQLSRGEIGAALRSIAAGISRRLDEFAETIALEAAKPLKTARGEVERSIGTFELAAEEARRFVGEVVPIDAQTVGANRFAWTERIPRGLIYGITPFNFPLNLVAHKAAPALASKNTIIIKPSPKTPLTALLLAEVFAECGLPKSALQVVPMNTALIDEIYRADEIKMISFTGSAEIGWQLKAKAGKKTVALELGGNAPVIIDETADIEKSVERTVFGAFTHAGQVCISVQRVLLHEKIADEWTSKFVERTKKLQIGCPLDEKTDLSAMISIEAAQNIENLIGEAAENGAKILCGGKRDGAILPPTILTGVDAEMRVVSEEVFAPLVCIQHFTDFDEAINLANSTKYGLQAGVFTKDLAQTRKAADALEYGGVMINDVPTFRADNMPYGGVKDSGFGREGVRYAMEEMSETRVIVVNT